MPTFEISLSDGRKFHVDAADAASAQSDLMKHVQTPQPQQGDALSGIGTAAQSGLSNLVSGFGETGKRYLGVGQGAIDAGKALAPDQSPGDTTLYDDKGLHLENLPRYLAESSPSVAAAMGAAKLMPGPIWAKLLAGGAVGLGSMAGNYAKEATAKRTGDANAESNSADLASGLVRAAPEAALQSLPLGRFLGAPAVSVGAKGVVSALGRAAVDAGAMGAGNAGANAYDQLNQNGTVDPNQVINAGLGGAAVGGVMGAGRAAGDAKAAIKYSSLADSDQEHITEAANRMKQTNDALGGNLRSVKGGYNALRGAQADVNTELSSTLKTLQGSDNLSQASQNALGRAKSGLPLSEDDIASLNTDTNNSPEVADLARLNGVRDVLSKVERIGNVNDRSGTFTGGLSGAMGAHLRAFTNPVGAGITTALGLGHVGDIVSYSPHALATLAGTYGAARALDALTGSRSAGGAFANRFANPDIATPPIGSGQGQEILDRMAQSPTGPKIPLTQPWASQPPPQKPQAPQLPQLSPTAMSMLPGTMADTAKALAPQAPQLPQLSPTAVSMLPKTIEDTAKALASLNKTPAQQAPRKAAPPTPAPQPIVVKSDAAQPAEPASVKPSNGALQRPSPEPATVPASAILSKLNGKAKGEEPASVKPSNGALQRPSPEPSTSPATAKPSTALPEDGSIPDFLKRAPKATAAPTPPPEQAVAKQALSKLAAGPKIDLTPEVEHPAEEQKMSSKEFSEHRMAQYTPEERAQMNGREEVTRAAIERKAQWKSDTADKLAALFPKEGSRQAFYNKLFGTHRQVPVRQLRDALATKYPDKAATVNDMLANHRLKTIWNRVN